MKRGVLNYSITWRENGEKREELYFGKIHAVKAYLDMLTRHWGRPFHDDGISELKFLEIYKSGKVEDITEKVNKFLYN